MTDDEYDQEQRFYDDDPEKTPPYWDQRMGKRLKGDWTFYFIQYSADGGETYHFGPKKPLGFAALRVGRLGDIEQTATWNNYAGHQGLVPATPPGPGWKLHYKRPRYCLWRREAVLKKVA